jgi:hypothetical protein
LPKKARQASRQRDILELKKAVGNCSCPRQNLNQNSIFDPPETSPLGLHNSKARWPLVRTPCIDYSTSPDAAISLALESGDNKALLFFMVAFVVICLRLDFDNSLSEMKVSARSGRCLLIVRESQLAPPLSPVFSLSHNQFNIAKTCAVQSTQLSIEHAILRTTGSRRNSVSAVHRNLSFQIMNL